MTHCVVVFSPPLLSEQCSQVPHSNSSKIDLLLILLIYSIDLSIIHCSITLTTSLSSSWHPSVASQSKFNYCQRINTQYSCWLHLQQFSGSIAHSLSLPLSLFDYSEWFPQHLWTSNQPVAMNPIGLMRFLHLIYLAAIAISKQLWWSNSPFLDD